MKISNSNTYGLFESIVASGLPMMADYNPTWVSNEVENLAYTTTDYEENPHFKRACGLAANPPGSGHNNWLSGVLVSMDVTATQVWWMQLERYHFVQIVSSQSKMHRLKEMMKKGKGIFNKNVILNYAMTFVDPAFWRGDYTEEEIIYSCPGGLELTARVTTNYLQLKTIYGQRHNHRLEEWRKFCAFIETLPFAAEFITNKKGN